MTTLTLFTWATTRLNSRDKFRLAWQWHLPKAANLKRMLRAAYERRER